MLRQAMFSLVAGGVIGIGVGFAILKSSWLTKATIRFLRVALWFPFIIIFAIPDTFVLGIAAVMLCAIYHYLTAQSLLEITNRDALLYAVREATLQALFFVFIAQVWTQRWRWIEFPAMQNSIMGLGVLTTLVVLLLLINWFFKSNFQVMSDRCAAIYVRQLSFAGWSSFLGVLSLTVVWLMLWQATTVMFWDGSVSLHAALNAALELFSGGEVWGDIATSLIEIVLGTILGGLVAVSISSLLNRSRIIRDILMAFLPVSYISPIAVWLLIFLFVIWLNLPTPISRFFIGYGHKLIGVGLLTFFPLVQALWGLRHESSRYGILVAIDHALPVAFIAMLFGELYAATAGLGFMMVVASATSQYQKGLAGFLITVIVFVLLSFVIRVAAKQIQAVRLSGEPS